MRWAIGRGHDIRVGLEDTTFMPDARRAHDNQELVEQAVREVENLSANPLPLADRWPATSGR
jgi:uncharacterized protein (DUF849 family)